MPGPTITNGVHNPRVDLGGMHRDCKLSACFLGYFDIKILHKLLDLATSAKRAAANKLFVYDVSLCEATLILHDQICHLASKIANEISGEHFRGPCPHRYIVHASTLKDAAVSEVSIRMSRRT